MVYEYLQKGIDEIYIKYNNIYRRHLSCLFRAYHAYIMLIHFFCKLNTKSCFYLFSVVVVVAEITYNCIFISLL